jgi:hypothetical protein
VDYKSYFYPALIHSLFKERLRVVQMLFLLNLFAKCKPYPKPQNTPYNLSIKRNGLSFWPGKRVPEETTLLREIIETTHKNTVVVAPTGIAALNAGGVTIHSMFQLPFGGLYLRLMSNPSLLKP